jgi:hypothetical protein
MRYTVRILAFSAIFGLVVATVWVRRSGGKGSGGNTTHRLQPSLTASTAGPPTLWAERKELAEMRTAEFRRLSAVLGTSGTQTDNGVVFRQIAELGTPAAVRFLSDAYERGKRSGRQYPDGPDLLFLLWQIRTEESAAVLLRMIKDGQHDARLVRAYAEAAGPGCVPELRRIREYGSVTARGGAQLELLRSGDEPLVREYLERLSPDQLRLAGGRGRVQSALTTVCDAGLVRAAPTLRRLAEHLSENPRDLLYVRTVHALLYLGDSAGVPLAIRVLEVTRPGERLEPGGSSIAESLRYHTDQTLGDDATAWWAWWERGGKDAPLYTGEHCIRAGPAVRWAAIAWARSTASGPMFPGPAVYVHGDFRRSTEAIRFLAEHEATLLGIQLNSVVVDKCNGVRATVTVTTAADRAFQIGTPLELTKGQSVWSVTSVSPRKGMNLTR